MNTLVGFGASTMEGAADTQGGFLKRVERQHNAEHPAIDFINLGIGGNTTRDMCQRMAAVAPIPVYDLIVLLGCNDLPRDRDPSPSTRTTLDEYSQNLELLLPQIRGQRSLFISSFWVSHERTGVKQTTFDSYMSTALQIADRSGYAIWDLYRECQADVMKYWATDGMHFNDVGHQMIAAGVMRWLANDKEKRQPHYRIASF